MLELQHLFTAADWSQTLGVSDDVSIQLRPSEHCYD